MLINIIIAVVVLIALFIFASLKILPEYERGVMFTLGRNTGVKGPGLFFVVPVIQKMIKVDMRVTVMDVPTQDVISRDNVSVQVNAVVYFRVIAAQKAIVEVENFYSAISQLSQTTLRSVLGQHELDDMLAARDKLNADIEVILDRQTDAWGIKVANVEIKQVELDESMTRAIARQAEAERARRAKIINAEGELQAAENLRKAAHQLATEPQAMQLRYLQTLLDMGNNENATIVFPLPMDLIEPLMKMGKQTTATSDDARAD
ncbi:slipin family protein [Salinisphaera sp. Q1T1-3]|uniref:slipin family protein n=1 Tax=Salinisphaera sp. Q1T1-3 TaxID=2321229 RepID=UPI000E76BA3A|nr:slipin family protein [Salinisphaera sp. Q1T1-3]RJS95059.1 slipin family protein [Salinisphaera sp. Q1T1-3]